MNKLSELKPLFVEFISSDIEEGVLYISEEYESAVHLCACGCRQKTVTPPLGIGGWTLEKDNGKVTLRPSIGNFIHEEPNYHAHYYITNNKIEWL